MESENSRDNSVSPFQPQQQQSVTTCSSVPEPTASKPQQFQEHLSPNNVLPMEKEIQVIVNGENSKPPIHHYHNPHKPNTTHRTAPAKKHARIMPPIRTRVARIFRPKVVHSKGPRLCSRVRILPDGSIEGLPIRGAASLALGKINQNTQKTFKKHTFIRKPMATNAIPLNSLAFPNGPPPKIAAKFFAPLFPTAPYVHVLQNPFQ